MSRVITITREYAAGASSISRMLADRLGWRILDHDLITEVLCAARSNTTRTAPWQSDLWFRKLVQEVVWNAGVERLAAGDDFSVRAEVIEEAARMADCVIVGRGAQGILRGRRDVFHVFLYAPLAVRRERGVQLLGEQADIEAAIGEQDRAQADFVRQHFDFDWRDPYLYDLMVNTRYGYRAATDAIFAAARLKPAAAGF